ncbi:hypothetical protein [Pelosinus fermentans]|uniref:Uncharacterized protein n=1 Tax=Pelosinus fermentans B4 TaxID=1149862 RepID=I8RKV8_9FIRM|nr:hypothetical protein [Pelosinus fermentans]EIW19110.1 hypothetical protein FB4_0635 [Pelosinus fermentans B4]EIW21671.1 hypothetical protein FA11_0478 [Pelosinus fermentans A11]
MSISDLVSVAALILSIISFYKSNESDKITKRWEVYKENVRQKEVDEQNYYSKNNSRVSLIPYFHLSFNKKIDTKNIGNEEHFILPISLINLGRESATNIRLEPIIQDGGIENYFKTGDLQKNIHFVYEYLNMQYAFPGVSIDFSVCCKKHGTAYDVFFKIRFNDLIGRTYEQEFRFQYCFTVTNEFSMNHTSSLPICIEDSDRTSKPISSV